MLKVEKFFLVLLFIALLIIGLLLVALATYPIPVLIVIIAGIVGWALIGK